MFYILSLTHVVTDELIKNFPSAYSKPGSLFIIRTDDKAMICVLVDEGKGFVSFVNNATGTRVIPSAASIYDAYLHLFNRYGIAMSITFLKNLNGGEFIFASAKPTGNKTGLKLELRFEFKEVYSCTNDVDNKSVVIDGPDGTKMSIPYAEMISLREKIDAIINNKKDGILFMV